MQHTDKRPPLALRWLSARRRIALAEGLRNRAADVAEWIAPEMLAPGERGWTPRPVAYLAGGLAAVAVIVVVIFAAHGLVTETFGSTTARTHQAGAHAW
jgi:hypothetical protein